MPPTKAKNRWMKAQAWTASGGMSAFLTTERPTSHTELKTLAEVYTDPDKKEAADKEEGADHVGDDHAGDATSRDKFSEDEEEEEEEAETYF
nr:hypothetical protein BaRGS_000407 [Batillaria attramentaria]